MKIRNQTALSLTRRQLVAGAAVLMGGVPRRVEASASIGAVVDQREDGSGVTRSAEAIHQEVLIAATPARVYEALTDAAQFTKVTTFSSVPQAPPATIGREAGMSFSLFGGHIIGRQLELIPAQRIVQAWRVVDWEPGWYSIGRFVLAAESGQTKLVFDHTGFPAGLGDHLAAGWIANYWEPMKKYLAS